MASTTFKEKSSSLTRPARITTSKSLTSLGATVRATPEKVECPPPPAEIKNLDYWQCLSLFKQADLDGNATLEEKEFSRFIAMVYPSDVWWMDLPGFFKAVDVDSSGAITLEEFLGWVYSVPTSTVYPAPGTVNSTAKKEKPTMQRMNSSPTLSSASTTAGSEASSPTSRRRFSDASPTSPTSPKSPTSSRSRRLSKAGELLVNSAGQQEPILFEIHCSHCFAEGNVLEPSKLQLLDHMFKEKMRGLVKTKKVVAPEGANMKGVVSVTALLGTGIRFWDKGKMIAFREDPFTSHESMKKWVKALADIHVPLLFRIMTR